MTTVADQDMREWLVELLPKPAHKHIGRIIDAFAQRVDEVEIIGARAPIESVHAYGLTFRLDANQNAVTVRFPYGAEVTEWT